MLHQKKTDSQNRNRPAKCAPRLHAQDGADMTRSGLWQAAVAGALLLALTASAEPAKKAAAIWWRAPAFASGWKLAVGSGAEYRTTCSWGEPTTIDLGIAGEEKVGRREGWWLEVATRTARSRNRFATKSLFYLDGDRAVFVRGVVKLPGHPPADLPNSWLFAWSRGELALVSGFIEPYNGLELSFPGQAMLQAVPVSQFPARLPGASKTRLRRLNTPAGKLIAQGWRFGPVSEPWRLEGRPINVWLSRGAGPFGLVRARMRDSSAAWSKLLLTRVLDKAKDTVEGRAAHIPSWELTDWIFQKDDPLVDGCLPQLGLSARP
jgi:hypothetical protein